MVSKTEGEDFDIGANPSAEEAGPDVDGPSTVTVNAVVEAHRLQQTSFDKKSYMMYIKGYMKKVVEKLKETDPDRVDSFQKQIQPFIKKILGNFDEYDFFTGENVRNISYCLIF